MTTTRDEDLLNLVDSINAIIESGIEPPPEQVVEAIEMCHDLGMEADSGKDDKI